MDLTVFCPRMAKPHREAKVTYRVGIGYEVKMTHKSVCLKFTAKHSAAFFHLISLFLYFQRFGHDFFAQRNRVIVFPSTSSNTSMLHHQLERLSNTALLRDQTKIS